MKTLVSFVMFVFVFSTQVHASDFISASDKNQIIRALREGSSAQYEMTTKPRLYTEIRNKLLPYLTSNYTRKWMAEHVIWADGDFIAKPTDATMLYIPRFSFGSSTVMKNTSKGVVVHEWFPANEMAPGHYEAVTLVKHRGSWKVNDWFSGSDIQGYINR